MLNIEDIIANFYVRGSKVYDILISHGTEVAEKAIKIVEKIVSIEGIDEDFIIEASMLHDIGICKTYAKSIGCFGSLPYLCHGVEGKKMLDGIGLHKHALVCERHVGVGFTSADIIEKNLPLPSRDMMPISFEEKLICYSDKFFSKGSDFGEKEVEDVLKEVNLYGYKNVELFLDLDSYFSRLKRNIN